MVRYNIDDVSDDMVLGESIALSSGKLLLGAGYCVSKRYRERLKQMGFRSVLVEEEGTEKIRPQSVVNENDTAVLCSTMADSSEKLEKIVDKFREDNPQNIHRMLFQNRKDINSYIMTPMVVRQIETIIEQIMAQPQIVLNMASLKEVAGSFYERAVNVTITALCIGKKYQFSYDEIKQLATGALNYHVGIIALPKELLHKDSPFTDEEKALYHQHTTYGYLLLAQNPRIPPTSAIVALQHHELQNGSGYPLGLRGDNAAPVKDISKTHVIHRFAEIVAVADTYHALADQLAKTGLDESTVLQETLKKCIIMGGESLNSDILKVLFSIVPVYPVGTRVRLTDAPSAKLKQYIGVVAKDNPENLYRPVILLYRSIHGQKVDPPVIIDTLKAENIQFELYSGPENSGKS